VYAYVDSLLRDRAAAEDVTAQTFERAFGGGGDFSLRWRLSKRWWRCRTAGLPSASSTIVEPDSVTAG
jgi:DNA-directed RNA polymerase specialized sigma24 family protein